MRNIYLLVAVYICALTGVIAQFADDMESYIDGQTITGGHWTDWSCGGGVGCAIIASSAQAHSPVLSGFIPSDGTTDAVLDLGNKIFGSWVLSFAMYVPSNKEGSWNLQGTVPIGGGEWIVGNINFNLDLLNPGMGQIDDSALGLVTFAFPHDEWFYINMAFDINAGIGAATWAMWVYDGTSHIEVIPVGTAFTNNAGTYPTSLGGVNFFSINTNNEYYVDDFNFCSSQPCFLGVEDIIGTVFTVYPNPVKDILHIEIKEDLEISSLGVFDILGKQVLHISHNVNQLDLSHLKDGMFFLKMVTNKGVVRKKLIKE